jgi:hypothetical protein
MSKKPCNICEKIFTLKTLNKYGGICGRCSKPKKEKIKRKKISQSTRLGVWRKQFGNAKKGLCPVCQRNELVPSNFECGLRYLKVVQMIWIIYMPYVINVINPWG